MAADFRAARPEKAARELVIVVHLYPVGDAALTSPSRSLESVIGHCIMTPFPKFPIRSAASYVCKRNCSTSQTGPQNARGSRSSLRRIDKAFWIRENLPLVQTRLSVLAIASASAMQRYVRSWMNSGSGLLALEMTRLTPTQTSAITSTPQVKRPLPSPLCYSLVVFVL